MVNLDKPLHHAEQPARFKAIDRFWYASDIFTNMLAMLKKVRSCGMEEVGLYIEAGNTLKPKRRLHGKLT